MRLFLGKPPGNANALPSYLEKVVSTLETWSGRMMAQHQGTWKDPLRLGDYSIWLDVSNNLRVVQGRPQSDADGTVIGKQGTPTGAYTDPVVMNSHYLWVSSTGVLRIHTAAPAADTDGVSVGSQT